MPNLSRSHSLAFVAVALAVACAAGYVLYSQQEGPGLGPPSLVTETQTPWNGHHDGKSRKASQKSGDMEKGDERGTVTVHVCGEVAEPGVYRLTGKNIVLGAIEAAGGATDKGDLQGLNLAKALKDGEQVCVPGKGVNIRDSAGAGKGKKADGSRRGKSSRHSREAEQTEDGAPSRSSRADEDMTAAEEGGNTLDYWRPGASSGRGNPYEESYGEELDSRRSRCDETVNINTATLKELESLPGIGPVIALRIASYRRGHGSFNYPEQLMDVQGIKKSVFEKLQKRITVR